MAEKGKKNPDEVIRNLIERGFVSVSSAITLNLGNYESARLEARLTLPLKPTPDDLKNAKRTFKKAWQMIENEISVQAGELAGYRGDGVGEYFIKE
jgi:hypothetical protein